MLFYYHLPVGLSAAVPSISSPLSQLCLSAFQMRIVKWQWSELIIIFFIFLPNLTLLAGLHPLLHSGSCCVLFASVVQNLNGPNSDSCDHLLQDVVDEPDLAREPRNMYVITSPVTISLCFMFCFFSLLMCFNESLINVAGETGLHTQFALRA